jgi:large subunit ribosomal protein L24
MKADTSRKKLLEAKAGKSKALLHVHISKTLKQRMKAKKRSLLVKKGDKVKVMRGGFKGKEGKVAKVNYTRAVVFVEGLTQKGMRGKENMVPLQPSNLLLMDVDMTKERKELFNATEAKAAPKATEAPAKN